MQADAVQKKTQESMGLASEGLTAASADRTQLPGGRIQERQAGREIGKKTPGMPHSAASERY